MSRYLLTSTTVIAALLCMGCGASRVRLASQPMDLAVQVNDDANRRYPVAVAVVFVYSDDLVARLKELSARVWFQEAEQLKQDYPGCSGFWAYTREWVPGTSVWQKFLVPPSVKHILLYADYLTKGDHRFALAAGQSWSVTLHQTKGNARPIEGQLGHDLRAKPGKVPPLPRCAEQDPVVYEGDESGVPRVPSRPATPQGAP
ncbi:MAG: hypothetical protein ACI9WU_000008 [Myxococcota bacterium]